MVKPLLALSINHSKRTYSETQADQWLTTTLCANFTLPKVS